MDIEQIVMNIIINSGEARAFAYEALNKVKGGDYEGAKISMESANEAIGKAHAIQTELLQREAGGDKTEISILFVHAQDHLMTSISEKNLINEIIDLRKVVNTLMEK